jgi:hypothetical protein
MTFYTGSMFPELANDLLYCGVHLGSLMRARLGGPELDQIQHQDELAEECRLDVTVGPDGAIYYAGINRIYRFAR